MGTEIVNYDAQFAADAEKYAKQARAGGSTSFSTQAGQLKLNDEAMPGNQVCVIVVDALLENLFYRGKYVANDPQPPVCYAFGRDEHDMAPHESMQADLTYFEPQNQTCTGCPQAQWGSADVGRGKACKNQVKLAVIPAGMYVKEGRELVLNLFDEPKDFEEAEIAYLRVPVTSGKNWDRYVKFLRAQHSRPPYGVVTRIYLEPHETNQFTVNFEFVELLPNALAPYVVPRNAEAMDSIVQGYQAPSEEDRPLASARGTRRAR